MPPWALSWKCTPSEEKSCKIVNITLFLEVDSFAQNAFFLHLLKYGIPGSVLLSPLEEKSWKIVNIKLSKMKCTPQELSEILITGDAYFLHYLIEK